MSLTKCFCIALLFTATVATNEQDRVENNAFLVANPIRKVVTLLQKMQKTVAAEGDKEKELFDKYMCYCNTGGETLGKSIANAKTAIPQLESSIATSVGTKARLDSELTTHKSDREAAKTAMAEATAIREKDAAAYAQSKTDDDTNLAALKKATVAIEKGMGSSFLQTAEASNLRNLLSSSSVDLADSDRDALTSFLSVDQSEDDGYAPSSGQITGILKQMTDTIVADAAETATAEDKGITMYKELMAAKTKEIQAATDAIESKTQRVGDLAVEAVNLKEDLSDTEESLAEDTKFLADLEKNCKTVGADYAMRQKTRGEEQLAIADTIKILNDDDALELFKKTLPGSSLLQVKVQSAQMAKQALALVRGHKGLDFITLALRGKTANFGGVMKMIDEMVVNLGKEQEEDDSKKEFCASEFDVTEDSIKTHKHDLSNLEAALEEMKNSIATLTEEIAALEDGVKALDKSVQEATEQRKEEHDDYNDLIAADTAAKQILDFAKNRLNKFYNPKLYKAPPKRVLTDDDRNTLAAGGTLAPTAAPGGIAGTGVTVFFQVNSHKDAPEPPPPVGTYSPKGETSNGVIAMIDALIADMTKELDEAEVQEKDAQKDYETMVANAADKRAEDTKAIANKSSMKAGLEDDLAKAKEDHSSKLKELMTTEQYMMQLHGQCDWLLENFELRKSARTDEIENLKKSKSVLSGADYALVQKARKETFLRRGKAVGA